MGSSKTRDKTTSATPLKFATFSPLRATLTQYFPRKSGRPANHTYRLAGPPTPFGMQDIPIGRVHPPTPNEAATRRPRLQMSPPVHYHYADNIGERYSYSSPVAPHMVLLSPFPSSDNTRSGRSRGCIIGGHSAGPLLLHILMRHLFSPEYATLAGAEPAISRRHLYGRAHGWTIGFPGSHIVAYLPLLILHPCGRFRTICSHAHNVLPRA
jgi:hypothetical protein